MQALQTTEISRARKGPLLFCPVHGKSPKYGWKRGDEQGFTTMAVVLSQKRSGFDLGLVTKESRKGRHG